jgi:NTE family protein
MKKVLVLSGGGAGGCFQVGALEVLYGTGWRPDLIIGTSVGALNGAALSTGDMEQVSSIWSAIRRKSDILTLKWWWPFGNGLHSMKPLQKLVTKVLEASPHTEFWPCCVDLVTRELFYPSNQKESPEQMVQWTLASAAIPGIMELPQGRYADGGVREQFPIGRAIDAGADEIVAIGCNPAIITKLGWNAGSNWISTALRAVDIMEDETLLGDLAACERVNQTVQDGTAEPGKRYVKLTKVLPDWREIDTLDFDPQKIERGRQHGREVMTRLL